MAFSLTAVIEYLDTVPGNQVMAVVEQLYDVTGTRGIFNENFLPSEELFLLGYPGFKQVLLSLYETKPEFIEQHRQELHNLIRKIKEQQNVPR